MQLLCVNKVLDLSRPNIMAIVNVTPDSFFDGGTVFGPKGVERDLLLRKVEQLVAEGADIIDVGGESTRPGAEVVTESEELSRVIPAITAISDSFDVVCSVDTSNPSVMREAAQAGAGLINDVRALTRPGAIAAAADTQCAVCLMHMLGGPQTMQDAPSYESVTDAVSDYLVERVDACVQAGISREKILVDPGIGFGKTDDHNLALLKNLGRLREIAPVLLGVSRKSMFGRLLGRPLEKRLAGSLAVALLAAQQGVSILRVHDVAETKDVLDMFKLLDL